MLACGSLKQSLFTIGPSHSYLHLKIPGTNQRRACKDALEHAFSHLCTGSIFEIGDALRIIHSGFLIEHSRDLIARKSSKI